MEQKPQNPTKAEFNEAAVAYPGDPAAAEAYAATKDVATDAEAAGDAALSGVNFPDKEALRASFAGDPDTVAAQVAAEVHQNWGAYELAQFAEAHGGADPVTAAHAAVEAAQAKSQQPPQIPGASQGGAAV